MRLSGTNIGDANDFKNRIDKVERMLTHGEDECHFIFDDSVFFDTVITIPLRKRRSKQAHLIYFVFNKDADNKFAKLNCIISNFSNGSGVAFCVSDSDWYRKDYDRIQSLAEEIMVSNGISYDFGKYTFSAYSQTYDEFVEQVDKYIKEYEIHH